ncbi:MAG: hypothetical protein WA942_07905 [Mycolicibacter sinensis]
MDYPPEYVAARAVLLDALHALADHRPAIVVVGAQAVYLHTARRRRRSGSMTTAADLALDVESLGTEPDITAALASAGFTPGKNPGSWLGEGDVAVDITVVPSQSGRAKKTARAARLRGHADTAARITPGLEPALVDHTPHTLTALDRSDLRQVRVNVAGPAALLIAKAIKVQERMADTEAEMIRRVKEKDALDMLRLLQAVETADLVAGLRRHLASDGARAVNTRGLDFLKEHGMTPRSGLPSLATAATGGDRTVSPSFVALTRALLERMREG